MDGMDGMDGMGWDGRLSRSLRVLRAPNGANNGLEASFGNEACNASYLNVIRLLSHHRIPNSGPLFCPNILELFSQVPSWMKDNDQDEDGRLTYKEFKDSVMEAEKAEKHRA